jgi:hypothetical protein
VLDLRQQGGRDEVLPAMLAMGASKPWPDALEALTGQRDIDATAIIDYFAPLETWLQEQNKGQDCGWSSFLSGAFSRWLLT